MTTKKATEVQTPEVIASPVAETTVPEGSIYTAEFASSKNAILASHSSQVVNLAKLYNLKQANGSDWTIEDVEAARGTEVFDRLVTEAVKANYESMNISIYVQGRDPMNSASAGLAPESGEIAFATYGPYVRTAGARDSFGRQNKIRTDRNGRIIKD
jgi:hypothetical protein